MTLWVTFLCVELKKASGNTSLTLSALVQYGNAACKIFENNSLHLIVIDSMCWKY